MHDRPASTCDLPAQEVVQRRSIRRTRRPITSRSCGFGQQLQRQGHAPASTRTQMPDTGWWGSAGGCPPLGASNDAVRPDHTTSSPSRTKPSESCSAAWTRSGRRFWTRLPRRDRTSTRSAGARGSARQRSHSGGNVGRPGSAPGGRACGGHRLDGGTAPSSATGCQAELVAVFSFQPLPVQPSCSGGNRCPATSVLVSWCCPQSQT